MKAMLLLLNRGCSNRTKKKKRIAVSSSQRDIYSLFMEIETKLKMARAGLTFNLRIKYYHTPKFEFRINTILPIDNTVQILRSEQTLSRHSGEEEHEPQPILQILN